MFKKIKALAKTKWYPVHCDLIFAYEFAKNPCKYDFEFTFEENDMP